MNILDKILATLFTITLITLLLTITNTPNKKEIKVKTKTNAQLIKEAEDSWQAESKVKHSSIIEDEQRQAELEKQKQEQNNYSGREQELTNAMLFGTK
jgi:hypothetical protein